MTGPLNAHREIGIAIRRSWIHLAVGACFAAFALYEAATARAGYPVVICAVAAVWQLLVGFRGVMRSVSRTRRVAAVRDGGTVTALEILERYPHDDGGWTFVVEHDGETYALSLDGADGWPALGGAGGTHVGVLIPSSGAAPVAFTEAGYPFDLSEESLREWIDAVRDAAGGPEWTVAPARVALPCAARSSGGTGPIELGVFGALVVALVVLQQGKLIVVLLVAAVGFGVHRALRAITSSEVRSDGFSWKRRVGGGRVAWDELGAVSVRPAAPLVPHESDGAAIVAAARAARAADEAEPDVLLRIARGVRRAEPRGTRAENEDPLGIRFSHLGSQDRGGEPVVTLHDPHGEVLLRATSGISWRIARALAAEAVARGIPLR